MILNLTQGKLIAFNSLFLLKSLSFTPNKCPILQKCIHRYIGTYFQFSLYLSRFICFLFCSIEVEETFVDLVATTDWDLFKYDPPNNVWSAGEGEFCLCPTPGVQPAIPSTISPVPVLDEEEDEPATVPVVGDDTITSETELEGEEIEAIEAADGP